MTLKPTFADVAYATLSQAQKLDLYLPDRSSERNPLVVYIHGGAFKEGDKRGHARLFRKVLAAGYAVASLNYRMSGEARFPALVQDVKAAVRFLRANADRYRIDPERFAAWGPSAGGYLVAMLGVTGDVTDFDAPALGNAGVSSRVQAVVDWFGPTDFGVMDAQAAANPACGADAQYHDAADSPESLLLGAPVQDVPELVRAANPITYISASAPPFLIQHGTVDCVVPTQQSVILFEALVPVLGEGRVTLTLLENAGHGGQAFESKANMERMFAFLDRHLKQA